MLRVSLDTNVLLDLTLRREPWLSEAQAMWDARDAHQIIGYVPASSLTDLYYISRKQIWEYAGQRRPSLLPGKLRDMRGKSPDR